MAFDFGTALVFIIIGIVIGLIVGALLSIFKIVFAERKSRKELEQGKAFEIKGEQSPNKIPSSKTEPKKNWLQKMFKK